MLGVSVAEASWRIDSHHHWIYSWRWPPSAHSRQGCIGPPTQLERRLVSLKSDSNASLPVSPDLKGARGLTSGGVVRSRSFLACSGETTTILELMEPTLAASPCFGSETLGLRLLEGLIDPLGPRYGSRPTLTLGCNGDWSVLATAIAGCSDSVIFTTSGTNARSST